jgi:hypothetical protein
MERETWSPQMAFSFYFKKNSNKMVSARHLIKPFSLPNKTSSHTNLIFLILKCNIKSLGTNLIPDNLNQLTYRITGYTIFIVVSKSSSSSSSTHSSSYYTHVYFWEEL